MFEEKQQRQTTLFSFFGQPSKNKKKDESSTKTSKTTQRKKTNNEVTKRTSSDAASQPITATKEKKVGVVSPMESKTNTMQESKTKRSANIRKRRRSIPTTVAKNEIQQQQQQQNDSSSSQGKFQLCESMDDQMKENILYDQQEVVSSPAIAPIPKENEDERSSDEEKDKDDSESDDADEKDGLSAYERLRQRNIERNNARLASLGLLSQTDFSTAPPVKPRRKRKTPSTQPKAPSLPTRRSTRTRKSVLQDPSENTTSLNHTLELTSDQIPVEQEEEEEETYTVSPLLQYAMMDSEATTNATDSSQFTAGSSLHPIGPRLAPPKGLKAIYSLDFWNDKNWLVGAGKAGIVALWDCRPVWKTHDNEEEDMIDPILTWKAHQGRWIAEARFLPGGTASRLVTAANDGKVCLWDLSTVSVRSGTPKVLCQSGNDLHTSGIFAMDIASQQKIATGSKDKTVALSMLAEDAIRPIWKSNPHTAKVGAVRHHPTQSSLLASASDDGLVCLYDSNCQKAAVVMEDSHHRPHSVVWDPHHSNWLLTAGLDPEIKLWDIRSTKEPIVSMQGHVPETTRCKRIHHPAFYYPSNENAFVLSGGERSQALSMFHHHNVPAVTHDTRNQLLYSRGKLPVDCGDAGCIAVNGDKVAVSVHDGEVLILAPSLETKQ